MSALFNELPAPLPGVRLLEPRCFRDERGSFIKTYHEEAFRDLGIQISTREEYYSVSHRGVIRGMHFQVPPADHIKMVYCVCGRVRDVVVDVRRSSPTFGVAASCELSAENRLLLILPSGFAHGFQSLDEGSVMVYKTTNGYSPEHDAGIHWASFGFDWGAVRPVISNRDAAFPRFADFVSPFP